VENLEYKYFYRFISKIAEQTESYYLNSLDAIEVTNMDEFDQYCI